MSATRYRTRARSTGTLVEVEDTRHPEANAAPEECRWATICWGREGEAHGGVATHPTLAGARWYAAHPEEWCPVCQDG